MPAMPGYQPVPQPGIGRRTNTLAVTSLVLGVVQFVGWFIVLLPGLLAAILAIVLGFVAMKQVSRSGESGRGLAISGVILGFLGIVVVGILIIVGYASVNGQS
jgi:predicted PurR-regulated permease PerM